MKSVFIDPIKVHPDWVPFLSAEIRNQIIRIETDVLKTGFTPQSENVLRFLELPLQSVRVVILGQDPYHQPGVATGRAFEVGNLVSWNQPFSNISLKNILRGIFKAYTGRILKFNDLRSLFDNEFPVLGPSKLFKHWESQGVLLLNTAFTCETGKPGSHKFLWEHFSGSLLSFINDSNKDITWFLWGSEAMRSVNHLEDLHSISSFHPMMCFDAPGRDKDFLYGAINCFGQLKEIIDWTGYGFKPSDNRGKLEF